MEKLPRARWTPLGSPCDVAAVVRTFGVFEWWNAGPLRGLVLNVQHMFF